VNGLCPATFFKDAPNVSTRFFSTGVTSVTPGDDANANFFGGTDNVLRIVNKKWSTVNEWACGLRSFLKSPAPPAARPFPSRR
jgi:hypothetical protein